MSEVFLWWSRGMKWCEAQETHSQIGRGHCNRALAGPEPWPLHCLSPQLSFPLVSTGQGPDKHSHPFQLHLTGLIREHDTAAFSDPNAPHKTKFNWHSFISGGKQLISQKGQNRANVKKGNPLLAERVKTKTKTKTLCQASLSKGQAGGQNMNRWLSAR